MAVLLRRALISYRHISFALRTSSLQSHRYLSYLISTSPCNTHQSAIISSFLNAPATNFLLFGSRRGFAKGRKQPIKEQDEDEEELEDTEEDANLGANVKAASISQMESAVDALSRELAKLRTGRASAGMLDHIMVEHFGIKTPLNRMAVVSVLDPKTLSVTPYDPNALKELEKAIISSPLGLNPNADNQRLIVPIPPMTKEHIQAVCRVVAKSSEDVKQSIRRARQKSLDTIKKAVPKKKDKDKAGSSISADDAKRLEKEIDDLTKKFIKTAEDMCKAKEKEITVG
ncbi:Ribosome recycling factor [Olea europaea subsp. europaea]|uniref:Ribosome-recycling factor, chloroplastic n=1 Tax=Olea europaea subsp. europaea TaxID=158383 RepID=A0A8S0R2A3_OLEEU|nr:Ribosome recycling factor [Olea europaea subsp. europaea]